MCKISEFKVGDKVECLIYGKGEVVNVSGSMKFPVDVKFSDLCSDLYTSDGRLGEHCNVSLTKRTWKVEEIPIEETYKKGELVWANLGLFWDVYRYIGKAHRDDLHFLGSVAAGSQHMNVSFCNEIDSKHIRKFKDNPYDIND